MFLNIINILHAIRVFFLLAGIQWFVVVYLSSVDYKLYLRFDCLKNILTPPPFFLSDEETKKEKTQSKNNSKYKFFELLLYSDNLVCYNLKVDGKKEIRIFRY